MIEVVYTPKDKGGSNDVIRLPKNIKQIGNIKDSRKIYIEDYAVNHIEEAHIPGIRRVVGVLLGVSQKSGSDRYVFIKGAVTAPDVFVSETEIAFADSDWAYIYEMTGKYFPNQEIVGWFISMEGANASFLRTLRKVHADQFAGGDKVLFVYDRQEAARYFCIYENNQLVKQSGYTIYYERNEEMQDYMVDMRKGRQIEAESTEEKNKPLYRNKQDENTINQNQVSRKQTFVNYCANVAMVVLILFIGMYIVENRTGNRQSMAERETYNTITPVVKVDGEVYPTVNETEKVSTADETTQTEAVTETQTETETESTGYITVNTTQTVEATDAEKATTPETTQAAVVYKEHIVEKGDSLLTISRRYYGNKSMVSEIMKLNDIDDMDKIYEGQKIKLP